MLNDCTGFAAFHSLHEHRAQEFRRAEKSNGEAREFVVEFPGGSSGSVFG